MTHRSRLCLVLALLLAGLTACSPTKASEPSLDERVDALLVSRVEASVIGEFTRRHDVEVDGAFWDTSLDGTTPREELNRRVEDLRVHVLSMFAQGKEAGVLGFSDFEGFFADLDAENSRRAEAKRLGSTYYGPEKFTPATYLEYLLAMLQQQFPDSRRASM